MTSIVIDIRNVASSVSPDDRVYVWAPHLRERTGGGLTSTAPEEVSLVDGQSTIEGVDPGPLMVRFECMGISDTGDKMGVVPDDGPVDIFDVLSDSLDYPAPVVGAAQAANRQAQVAAERAEAGAESAWVWASGRLLVESPPGSGLYEHHPAGFIESPAGSGLYEFLA